MISEEYKRRSNAGETLVHALSHRAGGGGTADMVVAVLQRSLIPQ